jgi:hypothetical protein
MTEQNLAVRELVDQHLQHKISSTTALLAAKVAYHLMELECNEFIVVHLGNDSTQAASTRNPTLDDTFLDLL